MDKTHNISLGGFAFSIDDVAYTRLERYLGDIRRSLHNNMDVDEIMMDVEYRMAELLRERLKGREVVNVLDVESLITTMGAPSDYANDDEMENEAETARVYSEDSRRRSKKLFRNPDEKWIGGVASGLAEYMGVDKTWVRLAFVLLPFMDVLFMGMSTTSTLLLYVVLWMVIPEAKTTTEKLQMRGEPVNFDSIKDFFGNNPGINDNVNYLKENAQHAARRSSGALGEILKVIVKIIAIVIIANLLIVAFGLILAFFAAIFGIGMYGLSGGVAGWAARDYLPYLFDGSWQQFVGIISLALIFFIPAISLILIAMRIISRRYRIHRYLKWGLPILFLLGLIGVTMTTLSTASEFQRSASYVQNINVPMLGDTLFIERNKTIDGIEYDDFLIQKDGKFAIPVNDALYIRKSATPTAYMQVKTKSRGRTSAQAESNARDVSFQYQILQNRTVVDGHVYVPEGKKWRNQKVEVTLYLPENKFAAVKNFKSVRGIVDDNHEYYYKGGEQYYRFVGDKLVCVSCDTGTINLPMDTVHVPEDSILLHNPPQNIPHDSITTSAPAAAN
ncbi:MAG: PspC domain-containing protein [Weeksellaceae bacterium]|nr:PspC domain-containing protein [Weeksellaceae bacterium]